MTTVVVGQQEGRKPWHKLREIDPETGTATCAVCGPIEARWRGHREQWVCRTPLRESDRRRQGRAKPSVRWAALGVRLQDFAGLRDLQGGRCAICQVVLGTGRQVHLDHDHATGQVRALLCRDCNVGLGCMHDDPETLRAAASYIEAHRRRMDGA